MVVRERSSLAEVEAMNLITGIFQDNP